MRTRGGRGRAGAAPGCGAVAGVRPWGADPSHPAPPFVRQAIVRRSRKAPKGPFSAWSPLGGGISGRPCWGLKCESRFNSP